jgi:catechol 2,3-dioxygenase-like lactoylglutathione lyase family enzyme
MPSPFSGLDTVVIRVRDIRAATEWYAQCLGAEAIYEDDEQPLSVMEFDSDPEAGVAGSTITLWQLEAGTEWGPSSTYPILATRDARAAHAALEQSGVDVGELTETPGVWFFRFRDLDGNTLEGCEVKA